MPEPLSVSVATGIQGLDDILRGGLPPRRHCLVYVDPGVGKATLDFVSERPA